ncbi:hypothetical protein I8D64_05900 [Brachybacterium sp. MASK1Z-5]|uniref:DUF1918 domain-containing protein n=1 Tax=Brachybacterium halotolerans TaxID=2795215 RepID=A0ABS1B8G3_9MICO|nr:hypothetical protein [Brachybacterium halotolerans]MBK0330934.1 hypothetical protein [Brachybacterium halotolerans]
MADHLIGDTVRITTMPMRGVVGTVLDIDATGGKYLVRSDERSQGWYSETSLEAFAGDS